MELFTTITDELNQIIPVENGLVYIKDMNDYIFNCYPNTPMEKDSVQQLDLNKYKFQQ